eukprot:3935057-Rhodomonas_salina.1
MGQLAFVQQYALATRAELVIAVHGGALWNVVRWMDWRSSPKVVEILPIKGPGSTCPLAKMMNIGQYAFVTCDKCVPETKHVGLLDPWKLLRVVAAMNASSHAHVDCSWLRDYEKTSMSL